MIFHHLQDVIIISTIMIKQLFNIFQKYHPRDFVTIKYLPHLSEDMSIWDLLSTIYHHYYKVITIYKILYFDTSFAYEIIM